MIFLATKAKGLARAEREEQRGWQVTTLLPGRQINCLARDPFDRRTVYAGTQGHGVLRSGDRGRTWHQLGAQELVVKSLAPSPHEPGLLYAGTKPAAVFVSRDGGRRWAELQGFRRALLFPAPFCAPGPR